MLQKSDLDDDIAAYIAERLPQAEMKILFDIGANVGWFTTQFLKAYADCQCYLFEPVTANFEEIRTTLGRFPETNPFATNCASFASSSSRVPFLAEANSAAIHSRIFLRMNIALVQT